jgi:hypothetical protein
MNDLNRLSKHKLFLTFRPVSSDRSRFARRYLYCLKVGGIRPNWLGLPGSTGHREVLTR